MRLRERLAERLAAEDPDILMADGFEAAFVGVVEQFGRPSLACYDYEKVIALLMQDGLTREDAEEHFSFNVIGAYVGEYTPCFLRRLELGVHPNG